MRNQSERLEVKAGCSRRWSGIVFWNIGIGWI